MSASEAKRLTGCYAPGIYIPFKGVTCFGGDYGRLRLDKPEDDKKYHQRKGSKPHNYIQDGLTLNNHSLLLVEGEFKAISLTEAGFPAVGTSGFYSWGLKMEDEDEYGRPHSKRRRILHPEIQNLITALSPKRVVFIGDPDTALNWSFGDAMSKLSIHLGALPLALVRIPYDAPYGKGVDDIREAMGAGKFGKWFQDALNDAKVVKSIYPEKVIEFLLDRENAIFPTLTGDKLEKAIDQATKMYASLKETVKSRKQPQGRKTLAAGLAIRVKALASDAFKVSDSDFEQIVVVVEQRRAEERKKKAEEAKQAKIDAANARLLGKVRKAEKEKATQADPATSAVSTHAAFSVPSTNTILPAGATPTPPAGKLPSLAPVAVVHCPSLTPDISSVLDDFVMIGEKYYTYSYSQDGAGYRRSDVMSICSRNYVTQALKAAGFSNKEPSVSSQPRTGLIPNLNQVEAALFYLHTTRCAGTASLLYRPYGPIVQPDGTRLFNTSLVRVMDPQGNVKEIGDPRIQPIVVWLMQFFGDWQPFDHFISLLSYVYKAARAGEPKKTRAVFFIGPPNSGKSLLIDKIVPLIFGQTSAADAYRLIKGEAGTTSILSSYVCKLSDKDLGNRSEIQRVQQGILSLLADHTMGGRALYEDVKTVDVINLFMLSSNPDGSVIKMLEGMPKSIIEKFAIYEGEMTLAHATALYSVLSSRQVSVVEQKSDQDLIEQVIECLPYFCSFLENWGIETYSEPRFGVCSYVPMKFLDSISLDSKENAVKKMLLEYGDFNSDSGSFIHKKLYENEDNAEILDAIEPRRMSAILSRLAELEPSLVTIKEYEKSRIFTVTTTAYEAAKTEMSN